MLQLHASTGSVDGVAQDHLLGAAALALLPLAILALRRLSSWRTASPDRQLASVLLAASGLIHLGLVPGHLSESPGTSFLFLVNGVLFCAGASLVLSWRWWRPAVATLSAVTVVAYGAFVAGGRESVDDLGAVTKLIELFAFGLAVLPRRPGTLRWSTSVASVLLLTLFGGLLAWAGIVRDHAGASLQPPSGRPTAADRKAASDFASLTWTDLAPYQDVSVAIAAGYRPSSPPSAATVHYENRAYETDRRPILDPRRPQGLVYANTGRGPVLLGAMFVLAHEGQRGYDFNGAMAGWHEHPNACVSPVSMSLSGLLTPFGNCPPLSFGIVTTPMLHVWRPDMPNGPFGELDDRWVARIAREAA